MVPLFSVCGGGGGARGGLGCVGSGHIAGAPTREVFPPAVSLGAYLDAWGIDGAI